MGTEASGKLIMPGTFRSENEYDFQFKFQTSQKSSRSLLSLTTR